VSAAESGGRGRGTANDGPGGPIQWDAEEYARNSAAQLGWARELIGKLRLTGGESVLDIGCGDGKVTAELARSVPRGNVIGIDSSEAMIGSARAAFPAAAQGNLEFRLMDARALSFEGRFDVAFSNATLHWVKDHRPVLRGVARSLKSAGRVLFQMGGRGNGEEIFAAAYDMIASGNWKAYFKDFEFPWGFHAPQEYEKWCAEAGLITRRVELIPKDMIQKGNEGLAGWVRTTWMPYTGRVPKERRESFIREAVDRYLAIHPLNERGEATVRMVRLEVEAVRAEG
jgi:trans-aconitate 2-methyltransferase